MEPAPIDGSYWVLPGTLLAGGYPGAHDPRIASERLQALLNAGIRSIVNLMEERETGWSGWGVPEYLPVAKRLERARDVSLSIRRFPIVDATVPSVGLMHTILDFIDSELRSERPVFVHCFGGIGRTATVVGCWIARHRLAPDGDTIAMITRLRAVGTNCTGPSPQTAEQARMIRTWAEIRP